MIDATSSTQLPSDQDSYRERIAGGRQNSSAFNRHSNVNASLMFDSLFQSQLFQAAVPAPERQRPIEPTQQQVSKDSSAEDVEANVASDDEPSDSEEASERAAAPAVVFQPIVQKSEDLPREDVVGQELVVAKSTAPVKQETAADVSAEQAVTQESAEPALSKPEEAPQQVELAPSEVPVLQTAAVAGGSEQVAPEGESEVAGEHSSRRKNRRNQRENVENNTSVAEKVASSQSTANELQTSEVQPELPKEQAKSQRDNSVEGRADLRELDKPAAVGQEVDKPNRRAEALREGRDGSKDREQSSQSELLAEQPATASESVQVVEIDVQKTSDSNAPLTGLNLPGMSDSVTSSLPDQALAADVTLQAIDGTSVVPLGSTNGAASTGAIAGVAATIASVPTNAVAGVGSMAREASQANTVPRSETTSGATGATPVPESQLTGYQQGRLLQRVLNGLEQLQDGSSSVRLRLHPPELGALEVSLHMTQTTIAATITVESEAARQVLQENLPMLQNKLADQGLQVERFDIQTQSANTEGGTNFDRGYGNESNQQSTGQGSEQHEARQEVIGKLGNRLRPGSSIAGPREGQSADVTLDLKA